MNPKKLEQLSTEKLGTTYEPKMLTDIIPKGKTVLYGDSGAGKTYSIIKHLNRHKIKPTLLDFDFNKKVDDLDFYFVDGKFYLKATLGNGNHDKVREKQLLLKEKRDYLEPLVIEAQRRMSVGMERKSLNYNDIDLKDFIQDCYFKNTIKDIEDADQKINEYVYMFEEELKHRMESKGLDYDMNLKDEVIIIDTAQKALANFKEFWKFENFINILTNNGNDVILITHSHVVRNKKVPDIDEVFCNHLDCKLQLNRDILKSKKEAEVYLIVEKLRGYNGEGLIKGWER